MDSKENENKRPPGELTDGDASQTVRRIEELPPAAQRALAEAEERRQKLEAEAEDRPKEINGRDGLEPTRYGDWERKGVAVDF